MNTPMPRPTRVAHVLHGFVAGGIETWLVNVLREIDSRSFKLDFITSVEQPCFYDDAVRSLGGRIFCCPQPKKLWKFGPDLYRTLRRNGPYDVVHAHTEHFAGVVLSIAQAAGVPVRIAHSHSDTSRKQAEAGAKRRFYLRTMKSLISRAATSGIAVSAQAGASLFPNWKDDPRWNVLHCGIPTLPFRTPLDRTAVRRELGVPKGATVICHVGTFREPKNHIFLIEVAARVLARNPTAWLVLVADGPLRGAIEQRAQELGIADRTVFTGFVDDIVPILRASDVFLFPSLWEGLPLSVVEAQAAGLPCVISDVITPEVTLVPSMVRSLSLSLSADQWAEVVLEMTSGRALSTDEMLAQVETSPLSIGNATRELESVYRNQLTRHVPAAVAASMPAVSVKVKGAPIKAEVQHIDSTEEPAAPQPALLITMDTEGDNLWSAPREVTTRNAEYLHRFQALCERYGLRPTWLTNWEMAGSPTYCDFARDVLARDAGEVGMHLHAWNSPPHSSLDDFQRQLCLSQYPASEIRAKVGRMTELLEDVFEVKMISHRAGRWGMSPVYAKVLVDEGYLVDCSVTPHVDWSQGGVADFGGSDYRGFPDQAYWMDLDDLSQPGASPLLQVPMTIRRQQYGMFGRAVHRVGGIHRVGRRAANRLFPHCDWFRPQRRPSRRMLRLLDWVESSGRDYIEFMLHSSELMPGGSPSFPNARSIEQLYDQLETVFSQAADRFVGLTMAEYYDRHAACYPRPSIVHAADNSQLPRTPAATAKGVR